MKNIVIIGAGVSGLFTAYSLLKLNEQLNITVIDKNEYSGGKLLSLLSSNESNVLDLGAGRFNINRHSKLLKLCAELGIELIPFNYKPLQLLNFDVTELIQNVSIIFNDEIKEAENFKSYCDKKFGKQFINNLALLCGYNSLKNVNLSVKNGIKLLKDHPETQLLFSEKYDNWVSLKKGFQTVANSLESEVSKKINWIFKSCVFEINKIEDEFLISYSIDNKIFSLKSDTIFYNAPPKDVLKITFKGGGKYPLWLNHIQSIPLFKGFIQYEANWWDKYNLKNTCVFSDTFISKLYFPSNNNLVWFYSDGNNALEAFEFTKTESNITTIIQKHLGVKESLLPQKLNLKFKFWEEGISFFDLSYNYDGLNHYLIDSNFIICSDIFTDFVGWVEGSLISVLSALNDLDIKTYQK